MAHDVGTICRRVVYFGRVQGVGFRWTTHRIARSLRVDGYVRNCADGTVELLVQGPLDQVEAALDEVAAVMSGNIERAEVTEESVQADLSGFSIRR
jgi:acylphosphatase